MTISYDHQIDPPERTRVDDERDELARRLRLTPPQFPKGCRCGAIYWREQWAGLPLRGRQECADDAGEPYALELRNCVCGSTLAVVAP